MTAFTRIEQLKVRLKLGNQSCGVRSVRAFRRNEGWHGVCEAAGSRFILFEPQRGVQTVAQGKRGAGATRAALGQRSDHFFPLPRARFLCWGKGPG